MWMKSYAICARRWLYEVQIAMHTTNKSERICEICGASTEATSSGDLGCIACLLDIGLETDAEQSDGAFASAPDQLGAYTLARHADGSVWELGHGAMGVTYRAIDKALDRPVALKIINIDLGSHSAKARERFLREARAAAALRHPNVATVYQFGVREETGQFFYAMELVEGETLEERVRRLGPLDVLTTIDIALQVTAALEAAEKRGLVHRDLKPGNLMFVGSDDNGASTVKVIDLGIAKAVAEKTDAMALPQGGFVGTPAFASPEQFTNAPVDVRSDIYSLGATLWFLLTGHALFSGRTVDEMHDARRSKPLPIEQLKAAHVPRGFISLLISMLAIEPAARPAGPHPLAEKLQVIRTSITGRRKIAARFAVAAAFVALTTIVAVRVFHLTPPKTTTPSIPERSIAVLPFENLSEEKGNAYFAEGIKDEILTKLATVHDLKVISRTSTAKYQSKPDNLKTVAQELGVSTVLEGAVQKAGDKVRVNVQLIDARADTQLWAKSYDRELKDVLRVESEVSKEIAEALKANFSPSESPALASARTGDPEAYDLFLRGEYEVHQAESRQDADAYDRAEGFYRKALARDPNFAEAAAGLARARLLRHWDVSLLAPRELEEVKSIIDRALALAPKSPAAHFALGLFFYYGHRQYEMALAEFNRTLELQPNNALARQWCAYVYRRRGEWERSLADFQRAQELDPRDAEIPANIGGTYMALRLWKDAERAELRALAIDPQNTLAAAGLLFSGLNATGDVNSAKRAIDGFPDVTKRLTLSSGRGGASWGDWGGGVVSIIGIPAYLDVMQRRLTDAFQTLEKEVVNDARGRLKQLTGRAILRVLAGEREAAKSEGEEALPLLEARLRERPDDTLAITELSWIYFALGRNADALRLSRQAAELISIEKDALMGPFFQIGLAQIEARVGSPEEAIKRLRHLLSIPAGQVASIALLKIDPIWDPIRNHPDFQQLLSGPEQVGPPAAGSPEPATIPEKSTAVLPFENLSRDPDNAYFADGTQEEILARLAKIADLKVISRTSTWHYQSSRDDLPQIAKRLGVANILEGSVQKSADKVRVNVELIRAATDAQLLGDMFDRKLADIFAIERARLPELLPIPCRPSSRIPSTTPLRSGLQRTPRRISFT
jgi:TolB-like protein